MIAFILIVYVPLKSKQKQTSHVGLIDLCTCCNPRTVITKILSYVKVS